MVPVSDGWPPPCAWKIVEGVVRIMGSEEFGGGLKRDWIGEGREDRGWSEVMGLVCVWGGEGVW